MRTIPTTRDFFDIYPEGRSYVSMGRLTFPDFVFVGNRTAVVRQIGNAVPPLPGKTIYEAVLKTLRKTDEAER